MPFELSMADAIRFAVAVLVTASGVLSLLLFVARIRKRDYALLYFGCGTTIYGVRAFLQIAHRSGGVTDLALTLLLPIPLMLLMVEVAAFEWKKVARWIAIGELGVAILLMSLRLLQPRPMLPFRINSLIVLALMPLWVTMAFWPPRHATREIQVLRAGLVVFLLFVLYTQLFWLGVLPGSGNLDFIGFMVLLGCLGYLAVARAQRNEERLLTLHRELEIAKDIQARLLPESVSEIGELTIASRYVPATSVAGDFYDFLVKDDSLGVLIADVSGHGIPAALSASMVKVAVRAQMERAGDPAAVLRGMNSILRGNLRGQFVSAGYLFVDPGRGVLTYAGAGHPPLLVWRSRGKRVEILEINGLPLGIFDTAEYSAQAAPLERGDRCLLYTDGLLEYPCPTGEEFGQERLAASLKEDALLPAQDFCDALVRRLSEWCGQSEQPHDDLTVVVIDFA